MHPLTPDLTVLNDNELQKKYNEVTTKLGMAYRMGNHALISQLQMVAEDYSSELQARQQKLMEDLLKKDDKFKDIIEIK
jgi:predicted MPP superfamily phosphohydrolase